MTRINPIDLSFLLLERANRPNHMAAYTIFEKPKGQKSSFGPRLFDAYRHSQAAKPFNHKLKWLGTDVAAWETVEPDMGYHIRHLALPAPGSMQQFHETVSFLNTGLLDRGHPMWECYIIDGIERGRSRSCSRCTTRSSTVKAACARCATSSPIHRTTRRWPVPGCRRRAPTGHGAPPPRCRAGRNCKDNCKE